MTTGPSTAATPHHSNAQSKRAQILLLGDSITQQANSASLCGWAAHLSDIYQRRADVLNRGFSGYNTDWYLRYLDTREGHEDVFGSCIDNVKVVTIFFGANDASDPVLNPRHHVPLHRFKSNLADIASRCRASFGDDVSILIICPPPVHHPSRLQYQVTRYGDKATGKLERTLELSGAYAKAAVEVASDLGVSCLNTWSDMQESTKGGADGDDQQPWSKYLSDGLHLSREGNIFLGERLAKLIHKDYPSLAVHPCKVTGFCGNSSSSCLALQQAGPWHDEIDHRDAGKVFRDDCRKKNTAKKARTE